jgi:hypothetical protein
MYQIRELDPVERLSPQRCSIEFCVIFAIVFTVVRYGGWHQHMDPLSESVYSPSWLALVIAAVLSVAYICWRVWLASYSALPTQD